MEGKSIVARPLNRTNSITDSPANLSRTRLNPRSTAKARFSFVGRSRGEETPKDPIFTTAKLLEEEVEEDGLIISAMNNRQIKERKALTV